MLELENAAILQFIQKHTAHAPTLLNSFKGLSVYYQQKPDASGRIRHKISKGCINISAAENMNKSGFLPTIFS
jgi:hypothetical protein